MSLIMKALLKRKKKNIRRIIFIPSKELKSENKIRKNIENERDTINVW